MEKGIHETSGQFISTYYLLLLGLAAGGSRVLKGARLFIYFFVVVVVYCFCVLLHEQWKT